MFCVPRSVPYTQQALKKLFFFKQINKIYRKIQFSLWNSHNIPEEINQNGQKKSEKELRKNEVSTYKIDKWRERDSESMAEVSV